MYSFIRLLSENIILLKYKSDYSNPINIRKNTDHKLSPKEYILKAGAIIIGKISYKL